MVLLLHAALGDRDLPRWGLLGLLDEDPHHDQALAGGREVDRPRNSVSTSQAHLPELTAKGPNVGQPDTVRAGLFKQAGDEHKPGLQVGRQSVDLMLSGGDHLNGPAWHSNG
jgi:hypothetical protein